MEQQFKNWLIKRGYSETGAANSYSRAIPQISDHYSQNTGERIDIYSITDQAKISQIAHDYSQSGRFSSFGYEQHGRYRAAISRYAEFFVHKHEQSSPEVGEEPIPNAMKLIPKQDKQTLHTKEICKQHFVLKYQSYFLAIRYLANPTLALSIQLAAEE